MASWISARFRYQKQEMDASSLTRISVTPPIYWRPNSHAVMQMEHTRHGSHPAHQRAHTLQPFPRLRPRPRPRPLPLFCAPFEPGSPTFFDQHPPLAGAPRAHSARITHATLPTSFLSVSFALYSITKLAVVRRMFGHSDHGHASAP